MTQDHRKNNHKARILLLALISDLAVNNLRALLLYSVTLVIDGLLIAFVATAIAPIADYFQDPSFSRASTITVRYIECFKWMSIKPGLEIFLLVFVIANVVKAGSTALLYYFNRRLGYLISHDLSKNALRAIISSSLLFFISHPLGTIQNTLQREADRFADGILSLLTMTATLMQLFILSYVAWILSANMLMVCILMVVLFLVITRGMNSRIVHFASITTSTNNQVTQNLMETLIGAKTILAYGRGSVMLAKYSESYAKHAQSAVTGQLLQNGIPIFFQAFGFLAVSLGLYISIRNEENVPTLIAALWTLMRMVPLFSQFLGNVTYISNVLPSFIQYNSLIQAATKSSIMRGMRKFTAFNEGIRLNAVCFDYPERGRVLFDVSLDIYFLGY